MREWIISIHVLREESDVPVDLAESAGLGISIHVLREESDPESLTSDARMDYFNPRSP